MGHRFKPEHVEWLFRPERKRLLPVEVILPHLGIGAQDDIADLGCGPGFFTIPMAMQTRGTIYAVDVEPSMFPYLREKAEEAGVKNITCVESNLEQLRLPDGSVNRVLAAFVLHELDHLSKGLAEIRRILRPGGKLLILDWEKKESEEGPPVQERLDGSELLKKVNAWGFQGRLVRQNPAYYMILAE